MHKTPICLGREAHVVWACRTFVFSWWNMVFCRTHARSAATLLFDVSGGVRTFRCTQKNMNTSSLVFQESSTLRWKVSISRKTWQRRDGSSKTCALWQRFLRRKVHMCSRSLPFGPQRPWCDTTRVFMCVSGVRRKDRAYRVLKVEFIYDRRPCIYVSCTICARTSPPWTGDDGVRNNCCKKPQSAKASTFEM